MERFHLRADKASPGGRSKMKELIAVIGLILVLTSPAFARTVVVAQDATWPPMEFLDEHKAICRFRY